MKLLAFSSQTTDANAYIEASKSEWELLQRAAGVPYDKRLGTTSFSANRILETVESLCELKSFRKELGVLQKKWDKLASAIDAVLEPEK